MKTLEFKIQLKASADKVWHGLWDLENYKKWTNIFSEGSYYKTERFTEGSKIHFLTPQGHGMYSIIERLVENKYLAFRHIGEMKDFEEQPLTQNPGEWKDAIESYEIIENEKGVELLIKVDTVDEYVDMMNKMFPPALQILRNIVEHE